MQEVERAFEALKDSYHSNRQNATGMECMVKLLKENPQKIWWWSWELIGKTTNDGSWLSHRAPARASDLAIHHPLLVEDRKIGRFCVYRLRTENAHLIDEFLK